MEEFTQLRIKLRNWKLRLYGSVAAFPAVLVGLLLWLSRTRNMDYAILAVFLAVPTAVFYDKTKKCERSYREAFRQTWVPRLLQGKFTDLDYVPGQLTHEKALAYAKARMENAPREPFQERIGNFVTYMSEYVPPEDSAEHSLCLMEKAARQVIQGNLKVENFVSGQYGKLPFAHADFRLMKIKSAPRGPVRKNVLKGQWMMLDLREKRAGIIQIVQKGFRFASNGKTKPRNIYERRSVHTETWGLRVNTQNPEFDQVFRVYAQYSREAAALLTPSLMERLRDLASHGDKLMAAFVGDKLHIVIASKRDSFKPDSVFKQFDEEAVTRKIRDEIGDITQFIDELSRNNDLFMQEN